MKLTKVDITNFRCFESLTVPLQPDVNVFVGVNASGKTALLDAIAIALYGIVAANVGGSKRQRALQGVDLRLSDLRMRPSAQDPASGRPEFVQMRTQAGSYYALPDFPERTPSGEEALLERTDYSMHHLPYTFTYQHEGHLRAYFDALWREIRQSDQKALIPLPVVAYYRAHRRLSQMPQMGDIFQAKLERQDAFQNALSTWTEVFLPSPSMGEGEGGGEAWSRPTSHAFPPIPTFPRQGGRRGKPVQKFMSQYLDAGAYYQAMCRWFYLRENRELRERLQIQNDKAFEFPDLRAVRQAHPSWENPLEAPGILLIDEIELHLHPQWQQKIIPNLCAVFPNTQLVVATHSPQVLTTVESRSIFILRDRELRAAPIQTYGAETKRVQQEVMQTDSRPPDNANTDQIRELFRLINQGHLQQASTLCDALMHKLEQDEPTLIEAQTIIENRAWEKELGL